MLLYNSVQFFAYKMTVASENSMLNVDLNTVSLKASDCTVQIKSSSYL
jgi:phosphopantetheine adenylyltransferase